MIRNEFEQPSKKMEIYIIGDTHFPRGKKEKFKKVLDEIKLSKNRYALGLGDWCEGITAGDPRYNPEEMGKIIAQYGNPLNMIDEQWDMFEEHIKPLADSNQILGLHAGNHESVYARRNSFNMLKSICKRNNIKNLGDGMAIHNISYKNDRVLILTFHGCGGGISTGFTYNKLESFGLVLDEVNIIAAGHTHKLGVNVTADRLKLSNDGFKQKIQYHCACGSFLGNYDEDVASYAERKAYRPLPLGYVKVVLDRGEITEVRAIPV